MVGWLWICSDYTCASTRLFNAPTGRALDRLPLSGYPAAAMSTVYRKTSKGVAEIGTRAHRLVPRLRGALILVDGKRSDDELGPLVGGDVAATLASLYSDGFIEVLATLADRPAERAPDRASDRAPEHGLEHRASGSSDTVSSSRAFETLRRDAVRSLNDQLGPAGETIALELERAKTSADLQRLLQVGAQVLRDFRGVAAAESFAARFMLPPQA